MIEPMDRQLFDRARRAYEVGRLRLGARHAAALAVVGGAGAAVASGALHGLGRGGAALDVASFGWAMWLPATFALWTAVEWRGGAALRGGRIGAAVGALALMMPMWMLRTCCRAGDAMMGAGCCGIAGACGMIGGALGLVAGVAMAVRARGRLVETFAGGVAGMIALALLKCGMLLGGEAVGLLGGLAAGALASSLATRVVAGRRLAA